MSVYLLILYMSFYMSVYLISHFIGNERRKREGNVGIFSVNNIMILNDMSALVLVLL